MSIQPKGKKVTGTKKKDKITWSNSKAWKKALTVNAGKGDDKIDFRKSKYKNTLNGQNGNDKIYGGKKDDKITGGKGNDTINAGKGKNTLYFSKGDGKDTVLNGKGTDTLVFKTEKNINNIKVAYFGNDAVVTYNGGSVILKDYKKGNHSAKYIQVGNTKKAIADYFKSAAPTPIPSDILKLGTEGDDNIIGSQFDEIIMGLGGDDIITGGKGNDAIQGGSGNNTYIYNDGDGFDTITTISDGDILQFNNYNADDISLSKAGTDLLIANKGKNIINLKDFLNSESITKLQLKFADNSNQDIFSFIKDKNYSSTLNVYYSDGNPLGPYLNGTKDDEIFIATNDGNYDNAYKRISPNGGDDKLYSIGGKANYVINEGDGSDVIYQKGGETNLSFIGGINFSDVVADGAWQKSGNDLILKYDGANTITVKDYFTENNRFTYLSDANYNGGDAEDYFSENIITGTENNDSALTGTNASEIIRGLAGDDIITSGKGNDVLVGGAGNNTYVFNKGDGQDKIVYTTGSKDIIKFNDVDITELKFGYVNDTFTIKYGETDTIRLKGGKDGVFKITDKNDVTYSFIYDDTRNLNATAYGINNYYGSQIVNFEQDGKNVLIVTKKEFESGTSLSSNVDCNYIIASREEYNGYKYPSNCNFTLTNLSNGTFLVDSNYSNISINATSSSTIKFTDTTLDDVKLSLVPNSTYPNSFECYNFCLSYNSGESNVIFSAGSNHSTHEFNNINLTDYTGASSTLFDKLNLQRYYRYGTVNNAYEHTLTTDTTATGTAGNDFIMGCLNNSDYKLTVKGKGGSDTIWGGHTIYGYDIDQKNTTAGDNVKIYAAEHSTSTIYAQSETNEIIGAGYYNNTYYAYIDQKTSIWEYASDTYSNDDILNFTNTDNDNDKDGQLFDSTYKRQIHVVFNVESTYNKENDGLYAFGDISFVDNDNLALWQTGQEYKGITVTNNAIETINTTDGYTLTNTNIAYLASTVAGWLTSDGRSYGSVNDVLTSNNEIDITALIAKFDNANWQSVS